MLSNLLNLNMHVCSLIRNHRRPCPFLLRAVGECPFHRRGRHQDRRSRRSPSSHPVDRSRHALRHCATTCRT